jgi:two-component system chemotaxis response regulator CheB
MKIICIGSSTGGPRVLFDLFHAMPLLQSVIIIVQHIPVSTTIRLARRLSQLTANRVIIPEDMTVVKPGSVIIAPGDLHLILENYERCRLSSGEKVNFVRPSIDVTMKSMQQDNRHSVLGIILTGMGCDGAEGIAHLKDIGALTVAQEPHSCTIRSMPEAAIRTEKIDYILAPEKIREMIINFSESGAA